MRIIGLSNCPEAGRFTRIDELYRLLNTDPDYALEEDKFTLYKNLKIVVRTKKSFFAIFKQISTSRLVIISTYGDNIWNIMNVAILAKKYKCETIVTGCQNPVKTTALISLIDPAAIYVPKTTNFSADAMSLFSLI